MVVSPVEAGIPRVLLQELNLFKEGRVPVTSSHREGNEEGSDEVFLPRASSEWCNLAHQFAIPVFKMG